MKVGWQYCSDSPALLIFLKKLLVSQPFSSQPFSRQNHLAIFPVFSLPCYTLHGVSLMPWLPSVSAELVYGCTGECGEIEAGPKWYSPATRCCVACQQQLHVRWELLAWPASTNRGRPLLRSLGCIHACLEHRSFLPLTHILGSSAHLDLLPSHSLDPYSDVPLFSLLFPRKS